MNGSIGCRACRPVQAIHHLAPIRTCDFAISLLTAYYLDSPHLIASVPYTHLIHCQLTHLAVILPIIHSLFKHYIHGALNIQQKGTTRQYGASNYPDISITAITSPNISLHKVLHASLRINAQYLTEYPNSKRVPLAHYPSRESP
jgi:hypothetical protein